MTTGTTPAQAYPPGVPQRYAIARLGGADVAGLGSATGGDPPVWHVTFTVADRDGSVATAERLGAGVASTGDSTWTRTALLRDPQGAELTLSQFTPPA